MKTRYRLTYQDVQDKADAPPKTMGLCALPEGEKDPRYFYTLEPQLTGVQRRYFVKCPDPNDPASLARFQVEQDTAWICSPYMAAVCSNGIAQTMAEPVIERSGGRGWEKLSSQVVVYEYLPLDLEQFWQRQSREPRWEHLERLRGQILLKLIEGVAHLHQARLLHRDIKPGNIMVNCRGLCPEAVWPFPELDVKLTDLDGAYDERVGPPPFYVQSQFFQPNWQPKNNVWLDIYSICIVAMWLYGEGRSDGEEYEFLRKLSSRPLPEPELSEVIASADIRLPAPFLDCLKPVLDTALQFLGDTGPDAWKRGMEALCRLREGLHDYYFGKEGWRPMELLRPKSRQPLWSAVLQIDRNYWPVLGRGRCYHALSIMDRAREEDTAAGEEPVQMCSSTNAESLSVYYCKSSVFQADDCERLSSPPEIYLTCEDAEGLQGSARLKAAIFGAVYRGSTYENRLFAQRENLSFGENAVLYEGKPLYIRGENRAFLEKIQVRAVRFYKDEAVRPLPVYRSASQRTDVDINLILLVDSPANLRTPSQSVMLLHQIAEELRAGGAAGAHRPRLYGLAAGQDGEPPQSFCGGRVEVSPDDLAKQYVFTANKGWIRSELSWDITQPEERRYAFDPCLPTIIIACLEQRPECVFDWLEGGCPAGEHSALQWAADYVQVFLPPEAEKDLTPWEPLMPQFAAAVRPGGVCIVTPFAPDPAPPDPERRWLTAIRRHCCWM